MKKIIIILAIVALFSVIFATTMTVHTTNGNVDFEISEITSITFENTSNFNLSLLNSFVTNSGIYDFEVVGNYCYLANGYDGIKILDISDITNITLAGSYDTPGFARGIFVDNNLAYVADKTSGLEIYDISNPSEIILVGTYNTGGYAYEVKVSGNFAYVCWDHSGLLIIDISDSTNPTFVGSYNPAGFSFQGIVSENYFYGAFGFDGLTVVDITDPSNPSPVGSYNPDNGEYVLTANITNNIAYLANGNEGVKIVDISEPTSPSFVAEIETEGYVQCVINYDQKVIIADGENGIKVYNTSNINEPELEFSFLEVTNIWRLKIYNGYLYASTTDGSLSVMSLN